jgi:hypothetical protein
LAENQKHITHVLSESLSAMKLSQGQIAENRKSINQLIEDFNEIQNFSRTLAMDVQDLDNFVRLYAKFDGSLSDLHELESPDYSYNILTCNLTCCHWGIYPLPL